MNLLESLRRFSVVVADTGDLESIKRYKPQDATTNPSLIYKAAQQPKYAHLLEEAIDYASRNHRDPTARREAALDKIIVLFGREILEIVPGRVSTEVDAALSFDTTGTINKAHRLIQMYEDSGVVRDRVLIKIASTWEGIRAARELEKAGVHCNLTLLFSFAQAVACAEAGVTLISPFVGRIYDWHVQARRGAEIPVAKDPGVASVTRIYNYYKKFGYQTQIMGASFRSVDQIVQLAGCDLLTISPDLLAKMEQTDGEVKQRLSPTLASSAAEEQVHLDEKAFRWMHNEDAMANEKLAEGIRKFNIDTRLLAQFAKTKVTDGVTPGSRSTSQLAIVR